MEHATIPFYRAGLEIWLANQGVTDVDITLLTGAGNLQALKDGMNNTDRPDLKESGASETYMPLYAKGAALRE